ncbi:molybdopterin-guanine dinucleotide biosynthesis protein A [Halorubrum alkaliphilum]|uniref:Molybdopterin-guanine dinucleotide biosynthesis protein A n=1 Tax=Halorubrum alkaliphilum TaxID=261290 RepID=A0A8T4GES7_9EURY|nr:molybdenum cofactor guanylyltransferase [Halorubrum alkaliphilum]MBP1922656.1 molybdopterin-guanine dinucleotide biosynthesis protein A [Halorubrum alkaliphilum]
MPTGAIVAGGRSTRFGDVDKSVAELGGVPMIRRVANRLAGVDDPVPPGADRASGCDPVVDDLVVNCRPDQRDAITAAMEGVPLPIRWALDDDSDRGPVAGIRNACRAAPDEYVLVVACDMPFVDPWFAASLFDDARGQGVDGSDGASGTGVHDDARRSYDAAVPRLSDRWLQTTQAVYHADAMATACDRTLARGERKVLDTVEGLDAVVVDDATIRSRTTERTFTNVNTQAELDDAEAFLAPHV